MYVRTGDPDTTLLFNVAIALFPSNLTVDSKLPERASWLTESKVTCFTLEDPVNLNLSNPPKLYALKLSSGFGMRATDLFACGSKVLAIATCLFESVYLNTASVVDLY